jgi:hypothetical protein
MIDRVRCYGDNSRICALTDAPFNDKSRWSIFLKKDQFQIRLENNFWIFFYLIKYLI